MQDGYHVEVDTESGRVRCAGRDYGILRVPPLVSRIAAAGDLVEYGRRLIDASSRERADG